MGRKNILYSFTAINEADMSQASIVGQATNVAGFDTVTYLATWSGGQAPCRALRPDLRTARRAQS